MELNPHMQSLLDVLVQVAVREIEKGNIPKKHEMHNKEQGKKVA